MWNSIYGVIQLKAIVLELYTDFWRYTDIKMAADAGTQLSVLQRVRNKNNLADMLYKRKVSI